MDKSKDVTKMRPTASEGVLPWDYKGIQPGGPADNGLNSGNNVPGREETSKAPPSTKRGSGYVN